MSESSIIIGNDSTFIPEAGDIVVYDRVFINAEHDHIGTSKWLQKLVNMNEI